MPHRQELQESQPLLVWVCIMKPLSNISSSVLWCSASFVTALGLFTAQFKWLPARASGHVKFHTRQRPLAHGRTKRPSGCFPSSLHNDLGSSNAGTFADANVRLIRSLTALCRISQPADLRHARPWVPELSTDWPLTEVCGVHIMAPRRRDMAMRSGVSSSRVPTDEQGIACKKPLLSKRRTSADLDHVRTWRNCAVETALFKLVMIWFNRQPSCVTAAYSST